MEICFFSRVNSAAGRFMVPVVLALANDDNFRLLSRVCAESGPTLYEGPKAI